MSDHENERKSATCPICRNYVRLPQDHRLQCPLWRYVARYTAPALPQLTVVEESA